MIDKTRCLARTWKRELLPVLPQCSKKALPGHEFCSLHSKKLPYGRVDNPMDPCVQARIERSMKRKQRKSAKRWYCRYSMFKQAQATWNLENVDDMNDEQYTQALESVHEFLVRHAAQRHAWKLKPDQLSLIHI